MLLFLYCIMKLVSRVQSIFWRRGACRWLNLYLHTTGNRRSYRFCLFLNRSIQAL